MVKGSNYLGGFEMGELLDLSMWYSDLSDYSKYGYAEVYTS